VIWIQLVTLLAVFQFLYFGIKVGKARVKYKLAAPAMFGQPDVERHIRAHYNTLEALVFFLPSLWIAGQYWNVYVVAGLGAIYIIGRIIYFQGYVKAAEKRHMGFLISMLPVLALFLLALAGVLRVAVAG
jgi:glutathione S-transferase